VLAPGRRVAVLATALSLLSLTVASLSPCSALAAEGGEGETPAAYAPPAGVATEPPLGTLPACPEAPEGPYEGTDDAARELRALRGADAQSCLTVRALLQVLVERQWWGSAQTLALERSVTAQHGPTLAQLEAISANTERAEGGAAQAVTVANPAAISGPVAESVDASGEALRHALWFLAGAAVAGVVGYGIYRTGSIRA